MLSFRFIRFALVLVIFGSAQLVARDVIVEFKGAYFLPTNCMFKQAYHKGGVLWGPELTVQLCNKKNWYGFASVDYIKKDGRCLSVADSNTLRLVPLGLGVKYVKSVRDWLEWYLGLGFQPEYVSIKSRRGCVTSKKTQWAFGGIAKAGTYMMLGEHFLLDLFVDYSFVWTKRSNFYGPTITCCKANLSAAIFGAGLGYRF